MAAAEKKPLLKRGVILNDRWEILGHIATGGKGEVYRARQKQLDRDVAIKIVSPEFIESLEDDQEDLEAEIARFHREVLAMAQVRHPHVLQVYDFDCAECDGISFEYIAMEYIPGATLRLTMPPEGFGENEPAIRTWIQKYLFPVLEGVTAVHELGIIHRDLKPENVLLDGTTPKITDFGLAGGRLWQPITRSHHALGTIVYMAPEQFSDMALTDARADIYALGKILFEAVSGKLGKGNAFPLQEAILERTDSTFAKRLGRIIRAATAKAPSKRIPSVAELRRELEALTSIPSSSQGPSPSINQRRFLVILAAGLAVILGLGILYHFNYWPWEQRSGRTELADSPPLDLSRLPMTPGASIIGQDGSMLHLIPGGSFRLISSTKEETAIDVTVGSFLMDETEITNHQYVEFLNAVKENLLIKDQSVWSNDQPWLLMGEVLTGYEPIVYHGQRFRLTDTTMAANPVVRVTAAGAMAYAGFYGRRLPDLNEWFHAADARHLESNSVLASPEQPMGTGSQLRLLPSELVEKTSIPSPVGLDQPNRYGLKGLAGNVSEWVRNTNGKAKPTYYLVSGLRENQGSPSARALAREPWEAFATVGFRTALSVSSSLDSRTEIGGPNKLKTKQ